MEDSLLVTCLSNVLVASLLGGLGWLALRSHRPTWAHALYALALLKLITPPLFDVTVWTDHVVVLAEGGSAVEPSSHLETPNALVPADSTEPDRWSTRMSLLALWLVGSAISLTIAAIRIVRFRAWTRGLRRASEAVRSEVRQFSQRLGVRSKARVLVTTEAVSPMLCPTLRGPLLVLPTQILQDLDTRARHTMLVHELAHWRRGDWIIRFVELLTVAAWWWLPLVYHLRRRLREAEELCCDAWVTHQLPGHADSYARALVAAANLVAIDNPKIPAHAMGMRPVRQLKERIHFMRTTQPKHRLNVWGRLTITAVAALCLPVAANVAQSVTVQQPARVVTPDLLALQAKVVDVQYASVEVSKLLAKISHLAEIHVVSSPSIEALDVERRTVKDLALKSVSVVELLDRVCAATDLEWTLVGRDIVRVSVRQDSVRVLGAVTQPGDRELRSDTTLLELVAHCDLRSDADFSRVHLFRPDDTNPLSRQIDLRRMLQTGDTTDNLLLRNDDIVFVASQGQTRVAGPKTRALINKSTVELGDLVSCAVDPNVAPGLELLALLNQPQRIGTDGTIFVPYLGSLAVLGLSRDEVESKLLRELNTLFVGPIVLTVRVSRD